MSKSLSKYEKIIIIKRVTDKILNLISELNEKKLRFNYNFKFRRFKKKIKIKIIFERSKTHICTAFYPDTEQTLFRVANLFLKKEKFQFRRQI